MIRERFNNNWILSKGSSSMMDIMRGESPDVITVNLPHDAMIHETPAENDPSGSQTGFYPGGYYIYTKKFDASPSWEGKDIFVEFEGVYMTAMVYLNGSHVVTNLSGYSGFYAKIDALLRYGEENEIKVVANNPTPNSRWYSGSGIYRNVNLLIGNEVHIETDGVRATTRLACEEEATVEIETKLVNITRRRRKVSVRTVLSYGGEAVKEDTVALTMFSEDHETIRQNLNITDPKLWNVDTPELYDLSVEVLQDGEVLDQYAERIGLRTLTLDAEHGLRINGTAVKQKGTCIHHDNGVIGAATFAAAEDRRARQIKEAGFNAVRSAHHPMSPEMLAACDRYGLLVMDELSDMWYESKNNNDHAAFFDVCWKQDIERMVAKDYNHPCVIMYSTGNEIMDLGHEIGAKINRRLSNAFHAADSTRFTTVAINGMICTLNSGAVLPIVKDILPALGVGDPSDSGDMQGIFANDGDGGVGAMNMFMSLMNSDDFSTHPLMSETLDEVSQAVDIAGFNYLTGRHGELEKKLHPNKPVLGTETYPDDIVRLWNIVEENPHVLGDYTWTGYDYLGEAGCGIFYYDGTLNFSSHYPDRLAYIGDINLIGTRRPVSYLRETVFGGRKKPYIAVIRMDKYGKTHSKTAWMYKDNIASWTWPGFEGKKTEVEIYSADDEVELFLNGRSLGVKPAGKENGFTAVYEVTYEPGVLEAVSFRDGSETGRFSLTTASEETVLNVTADSKTIKADGEDLAFVTLTLTDRNGTEKPFEKRTVTVTVEGEGILQGFGSANPQPENSYDCSTWETFDGKVMAVIRSTKTPGDIHVGFTAPDMEPASITIKSEM